MSSAINVLPLIQAQLTAQKEQDPLLECVLTAAVHGWMEGHLSAPAHDTRQVVSLPGELQSPPFPDPLSSALKTIVDDTYDRFAEDEREAAIAYAAALAWQTGRAEGKTCPGCGLATAKAPLAKALRAGKLEVRYHDPAQDRFALAGHERSS